MKITAIVDFFIHPLYFCSSNELRRARLFVRSCILTSLFSNSYVWLSYFFEYEKGVNLMIFNVLGFIILALLCKTRILLIWLGNLYVFVGASAIIILTYYSGGVWSAIYPWIVSIPVLALLVVNRTSGSIWGIISFGFMLWFAGLAYQEIELPTEYNINMRTLWYISVVPGLLLIVFLIAFVFEDIQTRALKELEENNILLLSQKETISKQADRLERLIEDKNYIIRILAHDLRNPLQNITSLADLIESEESKMEKDRYLQMINQSSSHAQDLVNRVLEMDASDQKTFINQTDDLDLNQILEDVIKVMKEKAIKKDIDLILLNTVSNALIKADKTYIHQIFENLISNAIKFSKNGTIVKAVILSQNEYLQVKIVDQGLGIDPNEENRLFKKFSKLSSRPTDGESSTGLGLSLVKRYAELARGKVWYERSEDPGAVFVVELPKAT